MHLDPKPIKDLYQAQPFKYSEFFYFSLGIYAIAVVCSLLIFTKSALDELAFTVISEQLAPVGIQVFCSIGIIFFTSKITFQGPIEKYEVPITKGAIWISKLGVGLLFTYVSIMLASLTTILLSGYQPQEPFSIELVVKITASGVLVAHFIYAYFFTLMANGTYLPNFRKPKVVKYFRVLVCVFLIIFLARTGLALYIEIANL
tara:strand:- start:33493 stop:34101 length:609 start_codon:yes stop_codon:yes gene_type:complete